MATGIKKAQLKKAAKEFNTLLFVPDSKDNVDLTLNEDELIKELLDCIPELNDDDDISEGTQAVINLLKEIAEEVPEEKAEKVEKKESKKETLAKANKKVGKKITRNQVLAEVLESMPGDGLSAKEIIEQSKARFEEVNSIEDTGNGAKVQWNITHGLLLALGVLEQDGKLYIYTPHN